ncbi:ATP-dependent Clp protease ATP-binding subunit [Patescibacteria group bacterium]|nr:ATP-dependent Clp protease ATP-binding subunit [Patescibacteria group bacterium]
MFVLSPLTTALAAMVVAGIGIVIYLRGDSEARTTGETDFTTDLTERARQGKLGAVIGMEESIERLIHVIARKQKNNPLLIGEPGVGKTAVIEGLAQRIVSGDVPASFRDKRILALNLSDLMAGTKYRGELEQRLKGLLAGLEKDARKTILFIDELHMIEQARGGEGSLDLADVLKPALSRGDVQVVGATTWKEYEQYLKPDGAIDRRFQPILVEEPSRENAIAILNGVKPSYEKFHGVCIPHATLEAAVDTSMQFIHDRFLPDKAFDVIDEACAKVALEAVSPHHARALGLLHEASAQVSAECDGTTPIVSPEDVKAIGHQWHAHRIRPMIAQAVTA